MDWKKIHATIIGLGVAGHGCAYALASRGARVDVYEQYESEEIVQRADELATLGVSIHCNHKEIIPASDFFVVSPGIPMDAPIRKQIATHNVPIWSEIELAWKLRTSQAPWFVVSGTNGKTTTTMMTSHFFQSAGYAVAMIGNIGVSAAMMMSEPHDVAVLELGAPQIPFLYSMQPYASVVLNIASDHIDHFGSFEKYVSAKQNAYTNTMHAAIYNKDDALTKKIVDQAKLAEECKVVGFTRSTPDWGEIGIVDGSIVDNAFATEHESEEIVSEARVNPYSPHNVSNCLAAIALVRSYGVASQPIREVIDDFVPAKHRMMFVRTYEGVTYVDDSKATNTHAALASILSYDSVIWIAGGLAKGQEFDGLVKRVADKLTTVLLLGKDQAVIKKAIQKFASTVPLIEYADTDPLVMKQIVRDAQKRASHGDTVLLAPGCASWDMFENYSHRGEVFISAVKEM